MRTVRFTLILITLNCILFVATNVIYAQTIIPADRKIDWSYAGIPGGIPNRESVCKTIDSSVYGDGVTDATAVIQNALTDCPDKQVVYLPAGTYIVTKPIRLRSYDTLRGAGPGLTILKHTGSDTGSIIQVTNGVWNATKGDPQILSVIQANKDASVITLSSASGIAVGDVLLLNQLNDGKDIDSVGTNGQCTFCGLDNGTRSLGQMVGVTDIKGDQVFINIPLHRTYDPVLAPRAYIIPEAFITRWSGIESMTITQDAATAANSIFLQGVQYFWIKNVEITNINSNGIMTYYALQSEFRDNYLHTSINGYGNSSAYGIYLTMYSSSNLIENNILDTLTGSLVSAVTTGNVWAYNYIHNILYVDPTWMIGSPILNHGAHPTMNLFEGNTGYMVQSDFIWGSGSHNTIFRMRSAGWMKDECVSNNAAVRLSAKNRNMNFLGNVLGTSGKSNVYEAVAGQSYNRSNKYIWVLGITDSDASKLDPQVATTIYRHGNYDYVTNSTVWDPGNANRTLPTSLYLNKKPGWWCQETPWPAIGPDVDGKTNAIPAQRRYEEKSCTIEKNVSAPGNLQILSANLSSQ